MHGKLLLTIGEENATFIDFPTDETIAQEYDIYYIVVSLIHQEYVTVPMDMHKLHYETKARPSDNLHNNFRCYSFAYRKDSKFHVLAY